MNSINTYEVKIYIAGSLHDIERSCRKFCATGLCVTVEPLNFIFTGGAESGARVGLINYARFPSEEDDIKRKALLLASSLMDDCSQRSCSVVTPTETFYLENQSISVPR